MKWRGLLAVFGCLLVAVAIALKSNTFLLPPLPSPSPAANTQLQNPLSVEALGTRDYSSRITKVRTVRQTERFTSEVVSYLSDGLTLYALLNTPKDEAPVGGWPVVIVNHGYIEPTVYSTENSYINTSGYYSNAGFAVLKPDYRGHDQSEGQAGTLRGRISYAIDVLNLLSALPTLDGINAKKVFMYGHSMGGDVTLRVLEVCPTCITAASLWAPAVTDWPESALYFSRNTDPDRLLRLESQLQQYFTREDYDDISTIAQIERISTPLLLHHGTADESVPYAWGVALDKQLREAHKSVTFYSYPNDTHDIPKNWSVALGRDVDFFKSKL